MKIHKLLEERERTHGNFHQGALVFNQLMTPVIEHKTNLDSSQFYALMMTMAKITRILGGNALETDHWQDIIGYIALGARLNIADEPLTQPLHNIVELPVVQQKERS